MIDLSLIILIIVVGLIFTILLGSEGLENAWLYSIIIIALVLFVAFGMIMLRDLNDY